VRELPKVSRETAVVLGGSRALVRTLEKHVTMC
jgi:hypothetical protein